MTCITEEKTKLFTTCFQHFSLHSTKLTLDSLTVNSLPHMSYQSELTLMQMLHLSKVYINLGHKKVLMATQQPDLKNGRVNHSHVGSVPFNEMCFKQNRYLYLYRRLSCIPLHSPCVEGYAFICFPLLFL